MILQGLSLLYQPVSCPLAIHRSLSPEKPQRSISISGEQPLPAFHGGRSQEAHSTGCPVVIIHTFLHLEAGGSKEKVLYVHELTTSLAAVGAVTGVTPTDLSCTSDHGVWQHLPGELG